MEFSLHEHINDTISIESPTTTTTSAPLVADEFKYGILKICLFSTFFVLGLIGNSLVLIGIGLNKGMQTPTNLLIFNLAVADILFIIVCIPSTLVSFFGHWPFADFGCKLAQFINHLSAFMSIYLLVFMSIDRYLAVVHAIDSMASYRTIKNTTKCIITLWLIGISLSLLTGSLFTVITFGTGSPSESMYCLLRYLKPNSSDTENNSTVLNHTANSSLNSEVTQTLPIQASIYWLCFVIFLYALPLTIIVFLYGLMLKFLRGARGQSVGKGKRRATRMILAVVLTYALCWFLMQLLFISNVVLSRNTSHEFLTYMDILTMLANVFAYLNSCTNPILYGFMSKNFRSSFIDLLCCRYSKRSIFGPNDSLRARRAVDTHKNNFHTRLRKSDYSMRASIVSHTSQLNPNSPTVLTTNGGGTNSFSSASRFTIELLPKYEPEESNNDDNHITVGTQTNTVEKSHRRRKHGDRLPVIEYNSLTSQSTYKNIEVLCM